MSSVRSGRRLFRCQAELKKKKKSKKWTQSLMRPLLTHLLHGMDHVLLMGRLRLIRLIRRRNQTDPGEIQLFPPFIPSLLFAHCCSFLGPMLKYFNHCDPPTPTPPLPPTSQQASRLPATSLPESAQRAKQIRWVGVGVWAGVQGGAGGEVHA